MFEKRGHQRRLHRGAKTLSSPLISGDEEQADMEQFLPGVQLTREQEHRMRYRQRTHLQQTAYHNDPSDRAGYEMFRRIVLHLSAIQDQKQLYAEPLTFERSWEISNNGISAEGLLQAIEKDFTVSHDQKKISTY